MRFLIFISIVLTIYASVNFYIFTRGYSALPQEAWVKNLFVSFFILLSSSFWIGRILENFFINKLTEILVWLGSIWLAYMLYFLIAVILIDISRVVLYTMKLSTSELPISYQNLKTGLLIAVIIITTIINVLGYFNFRNAVVREIEVTIKKRPENLDSLRIAVASDIHLGTIVRNKHLDKLIDSINHLKPDLILLPGDIIDEDLTPVIKQNLGEKLKLLQSTYGTFGVTGNHEYIGGVKNAVNYLENHGITMLRDTALLVNNSFYLIGREDRSISQFTNRARKNLNEILTECNNSLPKILMDHQPIGLREAEEEGIDLQLSGHTHHGQLFPLNFITEMIYEVSWGYKRRGATHYYVSSGFAGWGPPVRTGSKSEIVLISISFTPNSSN